MNNTLLFSEQQHWSPWLFLVFIGINAIVIGAFAQSGAFKKQAGQKRRFNLSHLVVALILVLSITFACFRLDTEIRTDGIYMRFFPTHLQYIQYAWNETDSVHVCEYSPLREFNGWGIRGNAKNKAYSMRGTYGIRIRLKNGSRVLIGTNAVAEATRALQQAGKLNN